MAVARRGQNPLGQLIHIGGQVGIGFRDFALLRPEAHGRAFLQRQRVERHVFRRQGGQPRNRVFPLGEALMGQAIHQIEVDVAETGGAGRLERLDGAVGSVAAAQELQQAVVEALYADAQPVHALPQQPAAGGGIQVAGVGFDGDLGPRADGEGVRGCVQNGGNVAVGQIRGGAAAEEHSAHGRAAQRLPPEPQLAGHRLAEAAHLPLDALVGVEVAIGAFGLAERHVHIQPHAGRGNDFAPRTLGPGAVGMRGWLRCGGGDGTTPVGRGAPTPAGRRNGGYWSSMVRPVPSTTLSGSVSSGRFDGGMTPLCSSTTSLGDSLTSMQQGKGDENQVIEPAQDGNPVRNRVNRRDGIDEGQRQ